MNQINHGSWKRGFTPLGIISTLVGLALFVYFINRAGVGRILEGVQRLQAGFLLVIAISAIRQTVRSIAWMLCIEAPHRLRFRDAFRARVMGDAIGNIVPFVSFMVAEPSKPVLIRDRVPLMVGFPALAIENIFYSVSVAVFILSGMVALLFNFHLPKGFRITSIVIKYCHRRGNSVDNCRGVLTDSEAIGFRECGHDVSSSSRDK
jgi:hypothetical protein